ncbi:MAG: cold shock domain-containing protein [Candidatus Pacebacteria bacterium]|nr:cold shock domain-containing protein [Candidatus Paceibacterota bacterium]MCD8508407.1 cold shock domain-containing protein [Candidatus Paceibacterota bacterium]MCD8527928.1 cold shock domain-containing protein [Candidatus Paceibacterota bacterium]MCD8563722.1 cold shock domain-containing protein [Candidatus Paceibacterota bacterium]
MQQGTIKRLTDKGFGFIAVEGQNGDIFFHASSLQDVMYDDLREGEAVSFDTEETQKGVNAVNVRRA